MSFLPDVNVWLAAAWARHVHHDPAKQWIDEADARIHLCRVTQMALLRLLSSPAVLGDDALTRAAAWRAIDQLRSDPRITWMQEPAQLEVLWRTMSSRTDLSHKLWTDDYLAAFAQTAGLTLVTFDQALEQRHPSVDVTILKPRR